jgi:hypothetical protein
MAMKIADFLQKTFRGVTVQPPGANILPVCGSLDRYIISPQPNFTKSLRKTPNYAKVPVSLSDSTAVRKTWHS